MKYIAPLWDFVKLDFGAIQEKTDTGIILPGSLSNKDILDVDFYPTVYLKGGLVSEDIEIGDKVLIPITRQTDPQGTFIAPACYAIEIKENGRLFYLVRQSDIIATLNEDDN